MGSPLICIAAGSGAQGVYWMDISWLLEGRIKIEF